MTAKELNKDINKLYKDFMQFENTKVIDPNGFRIIKNEFTRLYYADPELKYMSLKSVKIMLKIAFKTRFVQLDKFADNLIIE